MFNAIKDLFVGDVILYKGIEWLIVEHCQLWNHVHGVITLAPHKTVCIVHSVFRSPLE